MDLAFPPEAEAFRAEVRAFLAEHLPADWRGLGALDRDEAEAFSNRWRRTLAEHRMIGITWPVEHGGRGLGKLHQVVLAEEFAKAGVPIYRVADTTSIKMLGNTLLAWGTARAEGEVHARHRLG